MAKNKLSGWKSRSVFHVASQKSFKVKNKAKPVTTNLKKINILIPQQHHENKPVNVDEAARLMAQL
ncbi:ribosomal biogenesis factor-like isoform X2 [Hippopotamus amphibius kiboko]|uniref:ribosomal biogenesis factor-like isoform X2 n=1 Tax=Hippopotamus amphibius kiboko TaxID=575201 RepID=UPI002596E33A|nr:ribosomal biogenesis factor-like isoform X2 [Hippopotamus amphibius kiboko]